jgi:GTP-binding protein
MLVDEAAIIVKAGHGGAGLVSFFPKEKAGPDGGNGGKGGNVYLKATTDLMALRSYTVKKTIQAENGQPGGDFQKSGHDGKDVTILVPVGSEITVKSTDYGLQTTARPSAGSNTAVDRRPQTVDDFEVIEITEDGQEILIAKGGLGGRGNYELRSSRNTTPLTAQPGLPGEEKELEIQLKLIADFGLIGLPNAGKSSLLNELTAATPKIADYPFTTLEPNLGVVYLGSVSKIIADIPGLIEGASSGKGLGIKFLKHIEKTKVLLHCIAANSENPVGDFGVIREELEKYNPDLLDKEEIILLTKSDLVSKDECRRTINELKKTKKQVLAVSIHDWDSLEQLKQRLS